MDSLRTAFVLSNAGIVSSNPTRGMDVYMRLFCVCIVLCVCSKFLRRAGPLSKESHWLCIELRNWKAAKVQQKDCRAVDRFSSLWHRVHFYEDKYVSEEHDPFNLSSEDWGSMLLRNLVICFAILHVVTAQRPRSGRKVYFRMRAKIKHAPTNRPTDQLSMKLPWKWMLPLLVTNELFYRTQIFVIMVIRFSHWVLS
jgi:hypothetical protein